MTCGNVSVAKANAFNTKGYAGSGFRGDEIYRLLLMTVNSVVNFNPVKQKKNKKKWGEKATLH